jgi:hypothetical protein
MIKIRSSHFKKVCVQVLTAEACLGLSDGRFKQSDIASTVTAAVGLDLVLMRFEDVIQG